MQALARYTVELRRPPAGWGELSDATARARHAARELREEGLQVRLLRSVFVPEDDACFLLYEGPSAEAVRTAVGRAGLSATRELESIEED
jgi:uncharacterized protein DUF4242